MLFPADTRNFVLFADPLAISRRFLVLSVIWVWRILSISGFIVFGASAHPEMRVSGWSSVYFEGISWLSRITTRTFMLAIDPKSGSQSGYSASASYVTYGAAAVVCWTIAYETSHSDNYRFVVYSDVLSSESTMYDFPTCQALWPELGFSVTAGSWSLQVFGSGPMTVPASAFWFGGLSDMDAKKYNQTTSDSVSGVDSAAAISWHSRPIAAYGRDRVSIFVRWGSGSVHAPVFALTNVTSPMYVTDSLCFQFTLYSEDNDDMTVFVVFDGNYADIRRGVDYGLFSGSHNLSVRLPGIVATGSHTVTFCAMSGAGTFAANTPSVTFTYVSSSLPFHLTILPQRTPIRSPTRARSQSPIPSSTRTESRSASRTATRIRPTPSASQSPMPRRTGEVLKTPRELADMATPAIIVAAAGTGVIVFSTIACICCQIKPCARCRRRLPSSDREEVVPF
jgi:hypothetical protein